METINIKAQYDAVTGNSKHFVFKQSGGISGGIYIRKGVEVPGQIIITFEKGKKKDVAD